MSCSDDVVAGKVKYTLLGACLKTRAGDVTFFVLTNAATRLATTFFLPNNIDAATTPHSATTRLST